MKVLESTFIYLGMLFEEYHVRFWDQVFAALQSSPMTFWHIFIMWGRKPVDTEKYENPAIKL
jgi:hypothetical protein